MDIIMISTFVYLFCDTEKFNIININIKPGAWFNINMLSYQNRKPCCGDKTIIRSSYLYNRISYTGKMSSLYWICAQVVSLYIASPELVSGPAVVWKVKNFLHTLTVWIPMWINDHETFHQSIYNYITQPQESILGLLWHDSSLPIW